MAKLFILDTSVLVFDHFSIHNFADNDIIIPITVLEELDNLKLGNASSSFETRQVIRQLDELAQNKTLNSWISLGRGKGRIKIAVPSKKPKLDAEIIYGSNKNDHKILNVALLFKERARKTQVILVSKDINLRIKAKALGLDSEDYLTGKVKNLDGINSNIQAINDVDAQVIKDLYQKKSIDENGVLGDARIANGYYRLNGYNESALVRYNGQLNALEIVNKQYAYGIKPKNAEQTFALNALLHDEIKLVALQGVAGTGKTLLALASALEQKGKFDHIILARPIIPLSNRDIGFLPGDVNDKISPYMMPLFDNLKYIKSQYKPHERKAMALDEMQLKGELEITALTFIRGRSLTNTIFIIDEAQNLTPQEIKTIITRAGEGTKVIFTGDIHQIDTPYLDAHSNGLSYIIDRLKGSPLFAHIRLLKGERSALANLANEYL